MRDGSPDIDFLVSSRADRDEPTEETGFTDLDFLPAVTVVEEAVDLQALLELRSRQEDVAPTAPVEDLAVVVDAPLQPVGARRFVDPDPFEAKIVAQMAAEAESQPSALRVDSAKPQVEEEQASGDDGSAEMRPDEVEAAGGWKRFRLRMPRLALATYYVGLDIGSAGVKYVILKRGVKRSSLEDYGTIWLPPELRDLPGDATRRGLIRLLRKRLPIYRMVDQPLASSVSGLEVVFRAFNIPRIPKKELKEAVPWAARNHLPYPVEEAQLDFEASEKDADEAGKLRVHLLAARRDIVLGHVELLRKLRVQPSRVTSNALAVARLVRRRQQEAAGACELVMDIGARTTRLTFLKQGQVQFVREITTASGDFTEVLTGAIFFEGRQVVWSEERAEEMKRRYGLPEEDAEGTTPDGVPLREVAVQMRPVLERLVNEVQRSIDYYQGQHPGVQVQRIHLCGGGALLKSLADNLAKHLRVDVDILDPFAAVDVAAGRSGELAEQAPLYAAAMGLALETGRGLNLLPPPLRVVRKLQAVQKVLRLATILAAFAFGVLSVLMVSHNTILSSSVRRMQEEYSRLQPRRQVYLKLLSDLQARQRKLSELNANIGPGQNAVQHLRALSVLSPRKIVLVRVQIETRAETRSVGKKGNKVIKKEFDVLRVRGIVLKDGELPGVRLAQYLLALEASGYFRRIDIVDKQMDEKGNLKFTLDCGL